MAPSRMVDVSASVNLPLHHKVQKFSSGAGLPGWSRKKGRKMVVCACVCVCVCVFVMASRPHLITSNSCGCHQTYHSKNVTCFVGLIPTVIEIILKI